MQAARPPSAPTRVAARPPCVRTAPLRLQHATAAARRFLLVARLRAGHCRRTTHSLVGGGAIQDGFDKLDMDLTGRGSAGRKLGTVTYDELCYLPDEVARSFLFEFHAENYQTFHLPAIPSTASRGTIHKLLKTDNVWPYLLSSSTYGLNYANFD